MSRTYYMRCKTCDTGVWTHDLYDPCPNCGGYITRRSEPGVAINCIHWDQIGVNKDGYHMGIDERVTSKRDLQEKAARKGIKLYFT